MKRFRHAGKTTTAAIGDFDRPVTPHLVRAAKDVLIAATAPAAVESEAGTPTNWEGVIEDIRKSYAGKIADARRLPKAHRAAAVAALKWERGMAIKAARERRQAERRTVRADPAKLRTVPQEPTPKG